MLVFTEGSRVFGMFSYESAKNLIKLIKFRRMASFVKKGSLVAQFLWVIGASNGSEIIDWGN